MKVGINQWAFPPDLPTTDAISWAKRLGFEAFEVCVGNDGYVTLDANESDVAAIRRHAEAEGVALTSLACALGWNYPLSAPDPAIRERGIAICRQALRIGQWLGASALLTVPGTVTPESPYDEAIERALETVRELAVSAEKHQVALALENVWNKFLVSPIEMRDFIDQCESEFVGAYFDIGNIVLYGYPEQWIRILNQRIKAIHAKDFRAKTGTLEGFVMLLEGDVDWPAVVRALRSIGWDGPLTAEYFGYTHSREAMLTHIETSLRTIVHMT